MTTENKEATMARKEPLRTALDINTDGHVSEEELALAAALAAAENADKKEDQQRFMALLAIISMIGFTAFLFLPFISIEKISVLGEILSYFYIAMAGIIATFFGATAYVRGKND